ncbi:MAG: amino acid transporter [Zetaproteobacteria bacterium CG12_big_fil_rev_8_21_14_0_65_55_1124]|nr:MAG: amino acid transporter [Zetaproteobacteria bacterium CG1_02_55_237]PIS19020.1 MAG: amino acid transporter [Zetaproteobacteria bacterium CG08_land_8_20_14_0_20_55_17]PIW41940.1 MAG: amino acid transporter [Zetaproteobacteria bacterium CG12_big_fil_rev_8_21_14_0_65_55_1124]PIY53559.1 MAG: amino acid transporter [Zetaproteobacteria bacterium CG_4_10_14_0_8_um_filter_55_43]PIZ37428.1 MAG: amino acid transporter [Zetaproteobacteria bacterium CG_4_10_14_0_2_um_filter_55_20]PJB81638.1 MAG: am
MLQYPDYLKIFISLLAIVNPWGAVPIFISLIGEVGKAERQRIINRVAAAVGLILLASLIFGEPMLQFFGISIHSFKVGGGILLLLIAISMLNARVSPIVQTRAEADESRDKESIAVVPLAIPLLAGPGAISTVIIDAHKATGIAHYAIIGGEIVALSLILWLVLRLSPLITQRISATGINVFTRIMGLILAAIAIEFMASGLKGLFPALA